MASKRQSATHKNEKHRLLSKSMCLLALTLTLKIAQSAGEEQEQHEGKHLKAWMQMRCCGQRSRKAI
eukprot:scaffold48538_cov19-Tisochrysis_lutea.AAC.1